MRTKIAAFTMVDILTGMIITSIIIAMVFYLFSALNGQVHDYGNTRNQINQFMLLKGDIKRQFEQADQVLQVPNGIHLTGLKNEVSYFNEENILLRKVETITDTLYAELAQMQVFTQGDEKQERVEQMMVKIKIGEQELTAYFYKDYGLTGTINKELAHEF